jgi:hypothetical protein
MSGGVESLAGEPTDGGIVAVKRGEPVEVIWREVT